MNKKLIIGALVVCLLAFVAVMAFSQTSSNVRWEYNTLRIRTTDASVLTENANRLGIEGWELVTSTFDFDADRYTLFFKRRLP